MYTYTLGLLAITFVLIYFIISFICYYLDILVIYQWLNPFYYISVCYNNYNYENNYETIQYNELYNDL